MKKMSINNLKMGTALARDIFTFDGQLLLVKGTVITQEHLDGFRNRGVTDLYVMESSRREENEQAFAEAYTQSIGVVKTFMTEAKLGSPLSVGEITDTTDLLYSQVFDQNDLFRQMRLMKDKDDYLFTHSINVSLLCILIGRWLKHDKETIRKLGIAGLIHDIGKVLIDDGILNKPDAFSDQEYEEMKKHTTLGYEILMASEIENEIALAALMHHERLDGSGYPNRTKGTGNLFASAVAVADVYDAITSTRVYSTKSSPFTAAEILWEESFGHLDPRISKIFYDKVTNFYVGNQVKLSDGRTGLVVFINPSQPTKPIVQIGDEFIDLYQQRDIIILEIID